MAAIDAVESEVLRAELKGVRELCKEEGRQQQLVESLRHKLTLDDYNGFLMFFEECFHLRCDMLRFSATTRMKVETALRSQR